MSIEPPNRRAAAPPPWMRPGAFGLAIASDAGLPGLDTPGGVAGRRQVEHRLGSREELARRLGSDLLARTGGSGRGATRIEYHAAGAGKLLIRTASFGEHLIADGGGTVVSAVARAADPLWRRYVLGQVLPLTASLQGLEIFHASAVAIDGGVLALAGRSGAGKSSLAAALLASGEAAFFADDVLAVDATAFELVAYPGTTLVGLPHDQTGVLGPKLRAGSAWEVDEAKALIPVLGERRPRPVRGFLRLTPDPAAERPCFATCLPDRLMATTFDGVTRAPERLLRLLRVGAMLAADGRAQELRFPPGADPREVASLVLDRFGAPVGSRARST